MSKKMLFCKIIIGVVVIALGMNFAAAEDRSSITGVYTAKEAYGGDAYTGIQNAAATAGNNVNALGENINEIYNDFMIRVGMSFMAGGALYIGYVAIDYLDKKKLKN
jgi:hypothetical protein